MTIKDFDTEKREWLKSTDLENFFTISLDRKSHYVYNLNVGLYINVNPSSLSEFTLDHNMHWPLISYKIYGTTRFAWLLYKVNNVSAKDIFKMKYAGETVKFFPREYLTTIISALNEEK